MKKVYLVRPNVLGAANDAEIEKAAVEILHKVSKYLEDEVEEVPETRPEVYTPIGYLVARLRSMSFADFVVFVDGWENDILRACADECELEILDVTHTKEDEE